MKTFLEHTKENQEEGIGDSLKKGAAKVGGAIKKVATGGGKDQASWTESNRERRKSFRP